MGFIRYWWMVLREAWSESLDLAQAVLFIAIIIVGGGITMLPTFATAHDIPAVFEQILSWRGAAFALGSVVAARLILAPYYIWRRVDEENKILKDPGLPRIKCTFDENIPGCVITTGVIVDSFGVPERLEI